MSTRIVQFLAIAIGALALIPSGAHLAALPSKIGLGPSEYFLVQGIYRGWAVLGSLWVAALVVNIVLAVVVRSQPLPFRLALGAAACIAAMFAIFVTWTLPGNQATQNWTIVPANWETLRRQWEYSHAVNAGIVFLALCLVTASALCWRRA
ncbi:hypothetical protein FB547_11248 [Variovorax beijingensis]|jgi:hypothetical protein|uniref:DUF1772 domain-containing protein n=1 Tax=Variovorax beijingensis TaxID=2496117 RepID=A0A561BCH2_9BURK|nr:MULTISPECIES: DUF1772 domain-containing protein [Variovorax]MDP9964803.1 hypothetical protein [Variovorax paradoxus]TWD76412.1 hypothetical protein FB547_11248 [Variovorax beijingensis]